MLNRFPFLENGPGGTRCQRSMALPSLASRCFEILRMPEVRPQPHLVSLSVA